MDGDARLDPVGYWRARYATGGNSGTGAPGEAAFKAALVNAFVQANGVTSVIDFGCGDGRQSLLFDIPDYIGVDVSNVALQQCRALTNGDPRRRFLSLDALPLSSAAELALSLDVLPYLAGTPLHHAHIARMTACAERYLLFYPGAAAELRLPQPELTADMHRLFPDWRLIAHIPTPLPGDFFIYAYGRPPTIIPVPAAEPPCYRSLHR